MMVVGANIEMHDNLFVVNNFNYMLSNYKYDIQGLQVDDISFYLREHKRTCKKYMGSVISLLQDF
jgi:hypothetical protein